MKSLTLAVFVAAALALPASSHAQQPVAGPRWQGWLGCWSASPAERLRETGPGAPRIFCVTPTSEPEAVDVSAIAEGKVVSQNRIDATGATHAVTAPGCQGTESARWSGDGRRVFLQSHVTCDGLASDMNAILAITRGGEWIDVRRVAAGGGSDVRVARYHDIGVPTVVPREIADAFDRRNEILFHDARTLAGSPFSTKAIVEASHTVDAAVVESWVLEAGQVYPMDARSLNELADAGVPARVTDAMIAVSRPTEVAAHHVYMYPYSPFGWNSVGGEYGSYGRYGNNGQYGRTSADAWDQGSRSRLTVHIYEYDPWGWSAFPFGYRFGAPAFGYGMRYGNGSRLGDGAGFGYGWGYESRRYGTSGSRVGYYYPPVIVLHNDPTGGARGRSKGDDRTTDVRQSGNDSRTAHARPPEPPRREFTPPTAPQPRQAESRPGEAPKSQGSQSSGRSAKPRSATPE
ncbi:MAG: hypothetical protein M3Z05_14045 [Gemmatimonadota bacterium]|nr:hypothetical protein [Gemmatimonadota bacterium]